MVKIKPKLGIPAMMYISSSRLEPCSSVALSPSILQETSSLREPETLAWSFPSIRSTPFRVSIRCWTETSFPT